MRNEIKIPKLERMSISMGVSPYGFVKNFLYNHRILNPKGEEVISHNGKFYELQNIQEINTLDNSYKLEVIENIKNELKKEGKLPNFFYLESKFNRELTEEEELSFTTNRSYI